MKKYLYLVYYSLTGAVLLLLLLSFILTQKTFYNFLLQSYSDESNSLKILESNWHPIRPSISFDEIYLKNDFYEISSKEVFLQFSLASIFQGKPISYLDVRDVLILNTEKSNSASSSQNMSNILGSVENLYIQNLRVISAENINLVRLNLRSFSSEDGPSVQISIKDKNDQPLDINISSSQNSDGSLLTGFLETSGFTIEEDLLKLLCKICDFETVLSSDIKFTLYDNKLLNLLGNIDLNLDKKLFGFSSISSSLKLKDSKTPMVQFSALLDTFEVPNFLIKFSPDEPVLIFPKINLSQNEALKKLFDNLNPEFELDGVLTNTMINLDIDNFSAETYANELSIEYKENTIDGIKGKILLSDNGGNMQIISPVVRINSADFLSEPILFNDFNSELEFRYRAGNIEVVPSYFSTILNDNQLEGSFSLHPIPSSGFGDLDLRIISDRMDSVSALRLFPETPYLSSTKEIIDKLIDSARLGNINLLYRGPIDGIFLDNSGSFSMLANGKDVFLNINDYKIEGVNTSFSVNNFSLNGDFKEGKFLGSDILGEFKIYSKNSLSFLDIKGNSKGPFATYLKLLDSSFFEGLNSSGFHDTNFSYSTRLKKKISLLDKDALLEIDSNLEQGEVILGKLGIGLSNIFSSINYNSEVGLRGDFISFKVNSIPIMLEFDKEASSERYSLFSTKETIPLGNLLPENINNYFVGSSKTSLEIGIPSFIRGKVIKKPYLNLNTNFMGTAINLPLPFKKAKNEQKELEFNFYPPFKKQTSKFDFRYGNLVRGKFNYPQDQLEGFLIAGKDKQTISIEKGKISLIGKLKNLDLALFSLPSGLEKGVYPEFEIKKLEVDEILFSNFIFPKTFISSENSEQYFGLNISNDNISGKFFIPKNNDLATRVDLKYLDFEFSGGGSNQAFLDLYDHFKTKLIFETDSIVLNNTDYGNWAFNFNPSNDSFDLSNLIGTYGKWGLTTNKNGTSTLSITKSDLGWKTFLYSKIYSGSPEKGFKQIGIEPNFEMDVISIETDISWSSLPWDFSYRDFEGELSLQVDGLLIEDRVEIQAQNNILRLVNIFNVTDSFEKVTNLDFRKLYKSGFGADSVDGILKITPNTIMLESPLTFKSGSSEFKWTGEIARDDKGNPDELDLEVLMTLPLREYLPAYAFLLGGPVTAGVVYIAGKAFEKNLDQLSSGSWSVNGTLKEPKTDFNGWFEESD